MKKKILFALAASLVFLSFLSRIIEWDNFEKIFSRVDSTQFFIGFVFLVLANLVRTIRFRVMDEHGHSLGRWWFMNQNYNLMTATLPGGVGEVATAWILKRYCSFPFLHAVRILFITRIMDLLFFSLLMLLAVLQLGHTILFYEAAITVAVALMGVSGLALIPPLERLVLRFIYRCLPGNSGLVGKIREKLQSLVRASSTLHYLKNLAGALGLSALVIVAAALSAHYVLLSLGTGFSWQQSFYCFTIYALFQLVPIQGIAGIGTQAAWWALSLRVAGYNGTDYGEMGFFLHGSFYLFIAIMALTGITGWFGGFRFHTKEVDAKVD